LALFSFEEDVRMKMAYNVLFILTSFQKMNNT